MGTSKLAILRASRRWTLEHAAEQLAISVATLERWEKGKVRPRSYNFHRLCEIYEISEAELDEALEEGGKTFSAPEPEAQVPAFVAADLTMRLLSLAFVPHRDFREAQMQLTAIIEEFDMRTTGDENVTRREALGRLAMLPLVTFGLSAERPVQIQQHRAYDDLLHQCAASIAACWELSRSKNREDMGLAYDGATAYLPTLKELVKNGSTVAQRQTSASIVGQCDLLLVVLGWHYSGLSSAIQFGKEAVFYSKEAGDVPLQLSALKYLAWAYYYSLRDKQAMQCIEQGILLMKEHQATLPEYVQSSSYSTLAIVQARSGQPIDEALRRAEKTALRMGEHHIYTDPPLPVFILNTGLAWYHQRDYQRAWQTLSQVVDPVTLQVRRPLPERTRIEVINVMAAISLKAPEKDMERSLHLWKAGMNGAQNLQSEQRFTEALSTYHIMEALWPGDQRIGELREFITHW